MNRADCVGRASRADHVAPSRAAGSWLLSLAVAAAGLVAFGPGITRNLTAAPPAGTGKGAQRPAPIDGLSDQRESSPKSRSAKPLAPEYRELYVPTDELSTVLPPGAKTILLPREEFTRLFAAARANQRKQPPIGKPIVITQAEYEAHAEGGHLRIRGKLHLRQKIDGWASLPLPLRGIAVEKATLNGQPARLGWLAVDEPARAAKPGQGAREAVLQLLHDRAGTAVLELELSAELIRAGSDRTALFSLPPCPSTRMRLLVPAGQRVVLAGGAPARPAPDDRPATYELDLGGLDRVSLLFRPIRQQQRAETLLFARTRYDLDVAPGEVRWQAETTLQVFGKPLENLTAELPAGVEIVSVESPGLASWRRETAAGGQRVQLSFRQSLADAHKVVFRGLLGVTDEQPWHVPALRLPAASGHVGRIVIRSAKGLRLHLRETRRVRQLAPPQSTPRRRRLRSSSETIEAARVQTFHAWSDDFRLTFVTTTKPREIHAAVSTILDVTAKTSGLSLLTQASFQSLFAPLFDLDVELPADWTVAQVLVDGRPVEWTALTEAAGQHRLRVAFHPAIPPGRETQLRLEAHLVPEDWPPQDDPITITLPEVRLPQASVVEGSYLVKADSELDVVPEQIAGLDPAEVPIEGGRLGFVYQDTRFRGKLAVRRQPTRLSATTVCLARLERDHLFAHLEANLQVRGGGVAGLRVLLPEAVGRDLRFELVGTTVRLIEQQAGQARDGRRPWFLRFDRRLTGTATLTVEVVVPRTPGEGQPVAAVKPSADGPEKPRPETKRTAPDQTAEDGGDGNSRSSVIVPDLLLPDAEWQSGYVAIEAGDEQELTIDAQDAAGRRLDTVDWVDFPRTRYQPVERVVAAYRHATGGYRVILREKRYERSSLPIAVCHELQIISVLDPTGRIQNEAQFRFSAAGVQSLAVRLPPSASLWATRIDGQPVIVQVGKEGRYLVPLPTAAAPGSQHVLAVLYRTQTDPLTFAGRFDQAPPSIEAISGDGQVAGIEVLQTQWTLRYPPSTLLVKSEGPLRPTKPLDQPDWGQRWQLRFTLASRQQMAANLVGLAGVSLVLLVILLVRRGFGGCRMSLGALLAMFAGVLVLVLLLLPATERAREAARRTAVRLADRARVGATAAEAPSAGPMAAELVVEDERMLHESAEQLEKGEAVAERFAQRADRLEERQVASARAGKRLTLETSPRPGLAAAAREQREERRRPTTRPAVPPRSAQPPVSGRETKLARLSLAVSLDTPEGMAKQQFRYVGAAKPPGPKLKVHYQNATAGSVCRLAVISGVMLVFWWLRRRSPRIRGVTAVLGLMLPVASIPIAPAPWPLFLEGVLLGTLGGLFLWGIRVFVAAVGSRCCRAVGCSDGSAGAAVKVGAGLIVFALLLPARLAAQDVGPAQRPPVNERTPGQAPTVIVPYDPDQDPLSAKHILLPYEQFLTLWNRAHPDKPLEKPTPVAAVVSAAYYSIHLTDVSVEGRFRTVADVQGRFVLHSLKPRAEVALPLDAVPVTEARLDGQPVAIRPKTVGGRASLSILLPDTGSHVVDLRFQLPVRREGPTGELAIPLRPVPAGKLTLTLPSAGLEVRVNGSERRFRRAKSTEADQIEVPISHGGPLVIAWQPPRATVARRPFVQVQSTLALIGNDEGLFLRTGHRLQVRQGQLQRLEFALSEGLRVQQVFGPDVSGWSVRRTGDGRRLEIVFRQPIKGQTQLECHLFCGSTRLEKPQAWQWPVFRALDVTRETGTVALFLEPQFRVDATQASGLSRIDAKDFQAIRCSEGAGNAPTAARASWGKPLAAYRFARQPFGLTLTLSRRWPALTATADHAVLVQARKVRIASRVRFQLANEARSNLTLDLPRNFLVVEVSGEKVADWSVQPADEADRRVLSVELTVPTTGTVELQLRGHQIKTPDATSVRLVFPQPVQVTRAVHHAAVWVDAAYTAALADRAAWRVVDPGTLPSQLRKQHARPVQFALTSAAAAPGAVTLLLQEAVPRLTATSVCVVTVTDAFVDYTVALRWKISQAATRTFRFRVPSWLDEKLEVQGTGIRQVSHEKIDGQQTVWTITLHEPAQGEYFAMAQAARPLDTDTVTAPDVRFPTEDGEAPVGAQQHFFVLVNLSHAQLVWKNPEPYESLSAEKLPVKLTKVQLDQATAIVRRPPGSPAPTWTVRRFVRQAVVPASVNLADLVMVIAPDGTWRMQAAYTCKNRSRQFLPLIVPEGARILSVFVADRPARPVRAETIHPRLALIAMPKTSDADLAFEVKVVLEGRLPKEAFPDRVRLWPHSVDLPAPKILSRTDHPDLGIPVARTAWSVFLPDSFVARLVDDPRRTNLAPAGKEARSLAHALAAAQEALEMFDVLEGAYSYRSQQQAKLNIEKLYRRITKTQAAVQGKAAASSEARKLNELAKQLQGKLIARDQRDKEAAAAETPTTVLKELDAAAQTIQLRENADLFFDLNSAVRPSAQAEAFGKLGIDMMETQRALGRKKIAKGQGLERKQKAEGKGRAARRAQSLSQLQDLNVQLEQQRQQALQRRAAPAPKPDQQRIAPPQQPVAPQQRLAADRPTAAAPSEPTARNIALALELPQAGRELVFSKVGGDPKLALSLLPKRSLTTGWRTAWFLAFAGLTVMWSGAIFRRGTASFRGRRVARVGLVAGLILGVAAPPPISLFGLALFGVSVLIVGWHRADAA